MRRKSYKLTDRALLHKTPNDDDICKMLENIRSVCKERHNQAVEDIEKFENGQSTNLTNSTSKENKDLTAIIESITKAQELIKERQLQNSNCEIDYDGVD